MKKLIWIIILVLVVLGIMALAGGDKTPVATGPIKIGASLPMTGEAASYGEFAKAGVDLAVKEINDAGGINGRMVEVIIEDDKCDSTGSTVFNKLVNIDKVDALIGPICSSAGGPGLPIAQNGKTPTLILLASAPSLTKIGDYVFRIYPSDSFQGKYAAEYVFNTMGKKNVAVVYVKNDWGQGLHDVFTESFTNLGGKIVYDEGVPQDVTDLRTVMTKVKAANPDLIYYPMYPKGAVAGFKQMKSLGISIPVFGGDALDTTEVTSIPESLGTLLTFGKLDNPDDFKTKVKVVTGKESGLATPIAYDAIKILTSVMKEVGTEKDKVRAKLQSLSYTEGVSLPKIEFDSEGDLATAEMEIRVIKNGKTESLP